MAAGALPKQLASPNESICLYLDDNGFDAYAAGRDEEDQPPKNARSTQSSAKVADKTPTVEQNFALEARSALLKAVLIVLIIKPDQLDQCS